jgi:hypothetical protein
LLAAPIGERVNHSAGDSLAKKPGEYTVDRLKVCVELNPLKLKHEVVQIGQENLLLVKSGGPTVGEAVFGTGRVHNRQQRVSLLGICQPPQDFSRLEKKLIKQRSRA